MDRQIRRSKGVRHSIGKLRSTLPGLILESVLITFGVLLAFGIDNWKTEKKLRDDTYTVLENLKNELLSNRSVVLEYLSYHDSLMVRLDQQLPEQLLMELDKAGVENLYQAPHLSYILQKIAWETAHSTQVIQQFEYRTTYNLTHCYDSQLAIQETRSFLKAKLYDYSPEPRDDRQRRAVIRGIYRELADQEKHLLNVYRDALLALDKELVTRAG